MKRNKTKPTRERGVNNRRWTKKKQNTVVMCLFCFGRTTEKFQPFLCLSRLPRKCLTSHLATAVHGTIWLAYSNISRRPGWTISECLCRSKSRVHVCKGLRTPTLKCVSAPRKFLRNVSADVNFRTFFIWARGFHLTTCTAFIRMKFHHDMTVGK